MPIMASVTRAPRTGRVIVVSDDTRSLDFRSVDGSHTIAWDGVNLRVLASATGLDVPPREVRRDVVPGLPGSRLRSIRDAEREVFLPLLVASSRADWRGLLRRLGELRALMNYRASVGSVVQDEGTFDLVATTDGKQRALRCLYLDGMAGDYGEDVALPEWRRFGLSLLAVDPYWHGIEWSTPVVSLPSVVPFLSNDPADAFPRSIAPSVAIGSDMALTIPGDIPSPAVVDLVGPASSTVISSPSGLSVTIGALDDGDHFILDTGRTKRALLNGVDAWELVGQSPTWRPMAPGDTTVNVEVVGATEDTRARVYGTALWETAW